MTKRNKNKGKTIVQIAEELKEEESVVEQIIER